VAGLKKFLAKDDVSPEVNVGGVFRELENGKTNHASNKCPLQK